MTAGSIAFGIAGWSYEDWRGIVYPRGCKDTLRHVAKLVDCIEINSTFYRVPVAEHCGSWVERTSDLGTLFTAKLPLEFTHQMRLDRDLVTTVRKGFAPLVASGRLRALLAQFSYRFSADADSLQHLGGLVEAFGREVPIVVEVRHESWNDEDVMDFASGLGISLANLDYPGSTRGFRANVTGVNGSRSIAYFRLHGRNKEAWFSRDAGRDQVYNYEYSKAEVRQITERIKRIASDAAQTLVIANNHFHGNALKLVLQLLAWSRHASVEVPAGMLERFPDLVDIAKGVQRGLFEDMG